MKELKVGDRVAFYEGEWSSVDPYLVENKGRVNDVTARGVVRVEADDGTKWSLHPKQCRRLVKKRRRRLYALVPDYGVHSVVAFYDLDTAERMKTPRQEIQEFVEARRKK